MERTCSSGVAQSPQRDPQTGSPPSRANGSRRSRHSPFVVDRPCRPFHTRSVTPGHRHHCDLGEQWTTLRRTKQGGICYDYEKITRRRMIRKAAAAATVAMMTLGFAGLALVKRSDNAIDAYRVAPKGISELVAVVPNACSCDRRGTATGSTRSKPIPGAASTVNGGASWSRGPLKVDPIVSPMSRAQRRTSASAWGTLSVTPSSFAAGVVVTNNGGVSWTGRLLAGGDGELDSVACPSTTRCVAVGANFGSSGPGHSLVFASSNGGASWTPGALPSGTAGLGMMFRVPSTKFVSPLEPPIPTGWPHCCWDNRCHLSKDGGSSWTTATSPGTG